jgi:hypothetical protein
MPLSRKDYPFFGVIKAICQRLYFTDIKIHQDREQFLAAVFEHNPFYSDFSTDLVQLTWAKFEGNRFELTHKWARKAQLIALIDAFHGFNS